MQEITPELLKKQLKEIGLYDWLEEWDIKNVYEKVKHLSPGQKYLEIGVARGMSAAVAALAAEYGVRVMGIDQIDWKDRDENIRKLQEKNGKVGKKLEFFSGDSQQIARYWKDGLIDVLYIDGDHTYEGVIRDMVSWFPWVKTGGIIMFDDYNDKPENGVKQAINDLLYEHPGFPNQVIDGEMFICNKW